jgi:hypothetical protein
VTTSAAPFDDRTKRFSDLALKDYELKVTYLTAHFQRMWTRFNYFVVIETALLGGRTIFGDTEIGVGGVLFGACLSGLWYVMGAEDRYLVQVYRNHVQDAGALLGRDLWPVIEQPYRTVGDISGTTDTIKASISGWRVEPFSTTRLASLIPLAVTLVWIGMLIARLR